MSIPPDDRHDSILEGQSKPTGQQLAFIMQHLADMFDGEGKSYGRFVQDIYGYPSEVKSIACGAGQYVTNIINCARDDQEIKNEFGKLYL